MLETWLISVTETGIICSDSKDGTVCVNQVKSKKGLLCVNLFDQNLLGREQGFGKIFVNEAAVNTYLYITVTLKISDKTFAKSL